MVYSIKLRDTLPIFYFNNTYLFFKGDDPGPSGSIEGHGLRSSGRSGDPGGRGDADDYYYEV